MKLLIHSPTTAQPLKLKGMDWWFHRTFYWTCDYASMLGSNLNNVSKRGHCSIPTQVRRVYTDDNTSVVIWLCWVKLNMVHNILHGIVLSQYCSSKTTGAHNRILFTLTKVVINPVVNMYAEFITLNEINIYILYLYIYILISNIGAYMCMYVCVYVCLCI